MNRLKAIWFWIVAFSVIIWNTMKNNHWHLIMVDFHLGDDPMFLNPIRKRLIARRYCDKFILEWQSPMERTGFTSKI